MAVLGIEMADHATAGKPRAAVWKRIATALGLACILLTVGDEATAEDTDEKSREKQTEVEGTNGRGVFSMSIEELMEIEVISVSRTPGQDIMSSPAAIHVITQEDIRRSGLTSLAELLRMVPGMHVGRIDGNKWAITSRGFNSRNGRMLLVQVDGRTVYSPVTSGTFWEHEDLVLEDIERIEVIRGPGGTLWGANAVTGIINIVTKTARDTRGGLVTIGGGKEERGFGTLRYGGSLRDDAFYRVYGKYREQDETATYGDRGDDYLKLTQGGFRVDWDADAEDLLTLQGDCYLMNGGDTIRAISVNAGTNRPVNLENEMSGWNLLTRWTRILSDTEKVQVQAYYDYGQIRYPHPAIDYGQYVGTLDLDFQHGFELGSRHSLVWGLGYRRVDARWNNSPKFSFDPDDTTLHTFSAFVQDTISLIPERLDFIIGTKVEHNEPTGLEWQPNARLVWTPNDRHTFWASVSRALHVPSIVNTDGTIALTAVAPGTAIRLVGNPDQESEAVTAYELGYRTRPMARLHLDVSCFYSSYDSLRSFDRPDNLTLFNANSDSADSHGVEVSANWQVSNRWRLSGAYTWFELDMHGEDESSEGDSPTHQVQLRSYVDISKRLEVNSAIYYYDNVPNQDVSAFTRFDLGFAWRPRDDMTLSVWGQNLLDGKHAEYRTDPFFSADAGEIQRGIYGKLTWLF